MVFSFATLAILIIIGTILVVAILALFINNRNRQVNSESPIIGTIAPDAVISEHERPSSVASEQIEEMVKRKLEAYPDLADTVLDFGTVADGTIDIWVNRNQYDNVADIPDERIRAAIAEATAEFNN